MFLGEAVYAQQTPSSFLRESIKSDNFKNASVTFRAIDAVSGEVLSEFDPGRSLVCASTMKLFSCAATLDIFGPEHRFKTRLAHNGKVNSEGALNGDLLIIGGGDPALGSHRFAEHYGNWLNRWVDYVKSKGINEIRGRVCTDISYFEGETEPRNWVWADLGNYYGSAAGSLMINENTVNLYFSTSSTIGGKTELINYKPRIPGLKYDNEVKASTGGDNAYIFGGPSQYNRVVRGTLPKGRSQFKIKGSIPEPPKYIAYLLDSALEANGINVLKEYEFGKYDNLDSVTEIYNQVSPILQELIKVTLEESINLYAEAFSLHINKHTSQKRQENTITDFWSERIKNEGFYSDDGSGLSRYNSVNAENLTDMLQYMFHKSADSTIFRNCIATAGVSGTLKYFGKKAPLLGNFQGKSGSMNKVYSYAGVMKTRSGKEIILAAIINNYNCQSSEARAYIEELFTLCYEL